VNSDSYIWLLALMWDCLDVRWGVVNERHAVWAGRTTGLGQDRILAEIRLGKSDKLHVVIITCHCYNMPAGPPCQNQSYR
jgi:hypothetical protein